MGNIWSLFVGFLENVLLTFFNWFHTLSVPGAAGLAVILFTALNGAWMLVAGGAELLGQDQLVARTKLALTTDLSVSPSWLILIAFIVVGIAGIVVQYRLFGNRDTYSADL